MLILAVIAGVLPIAVPWLGFVFTLAVTKGLAALGVAMLLRAGLISIGPAVYLAMGAYAVAFLMREAHVRDLALLLAGAIVVTSIAGCLIGAFMMRYRAIFFAMLNLAISMVFFTLLSKLYHVTGGTDGLRVATPTLFGIELARDVFDQVLLFIALALMVVSALLIAVYIRSPVGEALSAIHTNEVRLDSLGVSARGIIWAAYTISAALPGLGGGGWAG